MAAKKKTRWHFEVMGTGRFPLDMLRYDGCFPRDPEDVGRIEEKLRTSPLLKENPRRPVTIHLVSFLKAPTTGRWESFGWGVRELDDHTL